MLLFFSALNRVLEPTVLMELKLSDGKVHTFEVQVYVVNYFIVLHSLLKQKISNICFYVKSLVCELLLLFFQKIDLSFIL